MDNPIHHTAYIHPSAIIYPGVTVMQMAYIGPLCVIGAPPQINGFLGKNAGVTIGIGARLEKLVTVDAGEKRTTVIGSGCMLMANAHVGHDCILEPGVVLSVGAALSGYCHIGQGANLSLNCCVHQYQRIGAYAMLGMGAVITKHAQVLPGTMWAGVPAKQIGTNKVGLERAGLNEKDVHELTIKFLCQE